MGVVDSSGVDGGSAPFKGFAPGEMRRTVLWRKSGDALLLLRGAEMVGGWRLPEVWREPNDGVPKWISSHDRER